MSRARLQLESVEQTLGLYAQRHSAPEVLKPDFTIRLARSKEDAAKRKLDVAGRGQPGRRYLVQEWIDWGIIASLLARRVQLLARLK